MFLSYLTNFKWIIGAIGAVASICSIVYYIDENGYNRAMVELQGAANEKIQEATAEAVKQAAKDMQKALVKQQLVHDSEIKRVASEREVQIKTEKVIEYVDKIITIKAECTTTDDSVISLLNESINNSNGASN